jgi:4-amino-4-deoxychorismate lyase
MDEGLAFGLGCFETILIKDKPYFLEEHLNRLNQSLQWMGLNSTVFTDTVEAFIHSHSFKNVAFKLIVTEKNQLATVRPIPYTLQDYRTGKRVAISQVVKSQHAQLIYHKTLNYGENILEIRQANKAGYDDCLFFNGQGHVTESAIANLFIIQDGQIMTPPHSDGLLPGIIRDKVMEHFNVKEMHINYERLQSCEGAFLTNSVMGAMPISQIEERKLPRHPLFVEIIHFLGDMIPKI